MNHLNSVLIEGILVDNPKRIELSDRDSFSKLAKFDLANDRYYMDKDGSKAVETVFVGIQCWGAMSERAVEKLSKGMTVRVVGRLRQSKWVNAEGQTRRIMEIVADHVEYRMPKNPRSKTEALEVLEGLDGENDKLGEPETLYSF